MSFEVQEVSGNEPEEYVQPYTAPDLLKLIDKALAYAHVQDGFDGSDALVPIGPVFNFFVCSSFEKELKKLKKECKVEEVAALKQAIAELSIRGAVRSDAQPCQANESCYEVVLGAEGRRLVYGHAPGSAFIVVAIVSD